MIMAAPAHKTLAIDLGLSVLCAMQRRDETLSCTDIADVCECSCAQISEIQRVALRKLAKKLTKDDYI